MDIYAYVEQKWGNDAKKNLANIRRGGDSNAKGSAYENHYAIYQCCAIAASGGNLAQYVISAQEIAFVDDLCIRYKNGELKTNYQAKNSAGTAADFTQEMSERFIRQSSIDKDHHRFLQSKQILLVSCKTKAAENHAFIQANQLRDVESEYFPYFSKITALIRGAENLKQALGLICQSDDPSVFDAACRVLLGVWVSESEAISVFEIFNKAKNIAHPDIFSGINKIQAEIPDWLRQLCANFPSVAVRVESGRYIINHSGFELSIGLATTEPSPEELSSIQTLGQLIDFLMLRATAEFKSQTVTNSDEK